MLAAIPVLLAVLATPAFAAPELSVSLTHQNPWGAAGKVDPFTGSATTFARPSGANVYTVTITNVGDEAVGTPSVGSTVACGAGAWTPKPSLSYQWLRGGAAISGATQSTYTTVAADEGKVLQCEVTAAGAEVSALAVSAGSVVPPAPGTTPPSGGVPTVTPTSAPTVGTTLTCASGTWTNSPTAYAYEWTRGGVPIAGATASTYTTTAADLGRAIQCLVTATNAGGSAVALSAASSTSVVLAAPPSASSNPTISGTASVGSELTCTPPATWTPASPAPTLAYRWLRDGAPISAAATASAYTLVSGDAGKVIQCRVTASTAEGATTLVSAGVQTMLTSPPSLSLAGAVTGTYTVGDTLTCPHGIWTQTPTAYEYQWLRNGMPITGASSGSSTAASFAYVLAAADSGTSVQCQVTASNAGGSTTAVSAGASSVVSPLVPALTEAPSIAVPLLVADQLPAGLEFSRSREARSESYEGTGWGEKCEVSASNASIDCTQSEALAPGESYKPLTLHVRVNVQAANTLTNTVVVSGGGAASSASASSAAAIETVPFGIASFTTSVLESLGAPFTQAAGHPWEISGTFIANLTTTDSGGLEPAGGGIRDIYTELPPGVVADPQNATQCAIETFDQKNSPCPASSVVGYVSVCAGGTPTTGVECGSAGYLVPLYNLTPNPGYPAALGYKVDSEPYVLDASVRSDGDYGITLAATTVPASPVIYGATLTVCENGVEGTETAVRGNYAAVKCAAPSATAKPFLAMPSKCSGAAPVTAARIDSWKEPGVFAAMDSYVGAASAPPSVAGGTTTTGPVGVSFASGCGLLAFAPEAQFGPSAEAEGGTSQADEPTGMRFDLKVPQTNEEEVTATPELKDATVTLPQGVTVSPSAADGLQSCSDQQFGLGSTVEPAQPAQCPLASQIGTVTVISPLLGKQVEEEVEGTVITSSVPTPLEGQVFVGEPECGTTADPAPCTDADAEDGHLFRLFLQLYSKELGLVVKLAGRVSANPETGQLQATFEEQPQLPFSELVLTLNGGPRAPLANPQSCGTLTTTTQLTPWSAPGLGGLSGTEQLEGTPDATSSSSFTVDWNGQGGACPASLPFSPSFSAGSQSTAAAVSSPFSVTFGREDREQDLSGITVSTPPGLLGKIAGVEKCAEAQANAGTCGAASQIGTTTVAAGAGADPFYLTGKVYLTGPYEGDPFGLSIVVPAEAGPFKLAGNTGTGLEVVRASIAVNPHTVALTVTSGALPQILSGVPLRLRKINVEINKPGFMVNPTSCTAQSVSASITAAQGASSSVASPYEVGGCSGLAFKPTLTAETNGKTSRKAGASLTVKITYPAEGQANIKRVHVQLPKKLPARQETLKNACLEATFDANPASCPPLSVIGSAKAVTPLLNVPLEGPAYYVSHGGAAFPEIIAVLQGEGVTIELAGETYISPKGIITSTFSSVPDAPVSSFELSLPQGSDSVLAANNGNVCKGTLSMPTTIDGQNGAQIEQDTKIQVTGCPAKAKKAKPKLTIKKAKLRGRKLMVAVKTSQKGRVRITGKGLVNTTKKGVKAGMKKIEVKLTKAGRKERTRHKKIKLRAALTVGKQKVSKTTSVKL